MYIVITDGRPLPPMGPDRVRLIRTSQQDSSNFTALRVTIWSVITVVPGEGDGAQTFQCDS